MKLVIMIPCLNEAKTLPLVLKTIPKKIAGIDAIDILVINDGSTDQTVAVAEKHGVHFFIHHARTRGLAYSLRDGMQGALELGADIMVLTDGDNQYPQSKIPALIKPILSGEADTVIADRQVSTIAHFSKTKKFLQRFGTRVLNSVAETNLPDSTSGFRAYTKEAAVKLNLVGRFNFAMETTMQASYKRLSIKTIKIKTNPKTRESRLFKSHWEHVRKSAVALINSAAMYRPYMIFLSLALFLFVAGLVPFAFYLDLVIRDKDKASGHYLQPLIIGTVLLNAAFVSFTLGIIANLNGVNRTLNEDILEEFRRSRFGERLVIDTRAGQKTKKRSS